MEEINVKFSVLMSIYKNEKAIYLEECFNSLLSQSLPANEWIIVEDGPLTSELYDVINKYKYNFPELIKIVKLEKNLGLGLALAEGIKHCSYDIVARMDTDDIAMSNRFEVQIRYFIENPDLDIIGVQIKEFDVNINNIISERIVPLSEKKIEKYQKYRCPFNHMTVMYKKQTVLDAGNYMDYLYMEDEVLWANMKKHNAKMLNTSDYLVYARSGKDMFDRRGGKKYYCNYKKARKYILEIGCINRFHYSIGCVVQFITCFSPSWVRRLIFIILLRKKS